MAQNINMPVDILIKEDSLEKYLTKREFILGYYLIQGWLIGSEDKETDFLITDGDQSINIDDISGICFDDSRSNGFIYCKSRQTYKNDNSAIHSEQRLTYFDFLLKNFGQQIKVVQRFNDFFPV